MKGVGSYNTDWAYYASPPSNLSAFAAPFSVNRSSSNEVSAPFMDSAESADPVVPPIQFPNRTYGYDFFSNPVRELDSTPPSKPYGYSELQGLDSSSAQLPHFNTLGLTPMDSFSYDQCSNDTKPSLVEAQPYYPSYVPSPIHDPIPPGAPPPNLWPSSSGFCSMDGSSLGYGSKSLEEVFIGQRAGLWSHFADLNHGKSLQVGVGSSFSSHQTNVAGPVAEERMNQGCQDVKDTINGEVSHMIGSENNGLPMNADQLDGKSCWSGTIKPMPVEFLSSSVMLPPSSSLETHHVDPLSYTGSYDKHSRQHVIPSRVDIVSSTPTKGLFPDLNVGNFIAEEDLGNQNFYNTKEDYHRPNSGTAGCFDFGYLNLHLERNEPSSSNKAMISSSDRNLSRDVVDYIFKEMHGFQDPHANLDKLSLRLCANEDFNSMEKSFDGADQCNPAVDSPCWKGAPAVHFSHYEASEALSPEYVHKNEKCFGSVIQEPQNLVVNSDNNVEKSRGKSVNHQIQNGISNQEMNLTGSPIAKFESENCNADSASITGPFQSEPSCCGQKYLNVITEMKENNVLTTKPVYDCESESSHTEHHVVEENKLMFQKPHTLCTDGANAGSNVNNSLECGVSHVAEHDLSSTSIVDAPTTVEKSAGKVSTQKLNVQMLVDTMHNLSELLRFHCLNDTCELKEQDRNVLKNVINNLNTCALKKAEQISHSQECLFPQTRTSRCAGQLHELQQNASFTKHQVNQVGPESSKVEFESPLLQEAKNHCEEGLVCISGSISPRDGAEMRKEDNMTKALKKVLSENFHDDDDEGVESSVVLYKNLWLEAEAALCSISYKARYNKMKIEMEKYKQKDMGEQSSLSESQSSATEVHIDPNPDSSVPNATNLKELSDLKFSVGMNKPNALIPEGKSSQNLDSSVQNSTVSDTTNKEAGDDLASVLARFHAIKSRVDKSGVNVPNLEEPSDIATVKLQPRESDSQNNVDLSQDSPTPCVNKADDYEASVMARLQILKSRLEDSSAMSSEDKSSDEFSGEGMNDTIIITKAMKGRSLDVHVNPSPMHLSSYNAVDKSMSKEPHLHLEDHEEIQPRGTYEFVGQSPTCSDGLALDWEHVEKRSLPCRADFENELD